jgi:MFS family permease
MAEQRVSRLLERYNPYAWMAVACLVYAVAVSLFNIRMGLITLISSFVILTLAELIYEPFPPTLYAKAAPLHLKARYQGAGNLAAATGLVIGPVVGELLLQWGGARTVWSVMTVAGIGAAIAVHQGRVYAHKDPLLSHSPPHFKQEDHHDELA